MPDEVQYTHSFSMIKIFIAILYELYGLWIRKLHTGKIFNEITAADPPLPFQAFQVLQTSVPTPGRGFIQAV
jgi:hypothetical protein